MADDIEVEMNKEGLFFMDGTFDEAPCNELKKKLIKYIIKHPKGNLTLYINSYGGDVHSCLMLYDLLESHKGKITTVCIGKAMSAGAYLMLVGDERLAYPNSRLMLHELASSTSYRKLHDLDKHHEENKKMQEILIEIVLNKTKLKNKERIAEYLKDEQFMSPTEAINIGLIDRIVR